MDVSVGSDHRFVARFARRGCLRAKHSDQGKGLLRTLKLGGMANPFVVVHCVLLDLRLQYKTWRAATRSANVAKGTKRSMRLRARCKAPAAGTWRVG